MTQPNTPTPTASAPSANSNSRLPAPGGDRMGLLESIKGNFSLLDIYTSYGWQKKR